MVVIAFKLIVIFVDARAKWRSTICEKIIILTQFEITRDKIKINNKSWPIRGEDLEIYFFSCKINFNLYETERQKKSILNNTVRLRIIN